MLAELWPVKLARVIRSVHLLVLSACACLVCCGCLTPIDSAAPQPHLIPNQQEKKEAAAECNLEIDALKQSAAGQEAKPCVKQKIVEPLHGVCATNGLGRECIADLDAGTSCLPNKPQLSQCDHLAKMENQFEQLGAFPLEEVGTTVHENDQ